MSLFVTGDLHGRSYLRKLDAFDRAFGHHLNRDDLVVVLGDLSVPWHVPADDDDLALIRHIDEFPWTTLFVDGNHENHTYLDSLNVTPRFGDDAHELTDHLVHLMRGRVYDLAGHESLVMGGARSLDADSLRRAGSWWAREVPDAQERTILDQAVARHRSVDLVLTHAPSSSQLAAHALDTMSPWRPDEYNQWLQEHIADRLRYRMWFYGHMHDDRPWEARDIPLMHVIYDVDSAFPGRLWGPESLLDDWYPGDPF